MGLNLDFLGLGRHADILKDNFEFLGGLVGTKTHDFASVADGARATTTLTVTGAELGDFVVAVSLGVDQAGVILDGYVSAADTVTVTLHNETGGAVDLASTTLRALVRKAA